MTDGKAKENNVLKIIVYGHERAEALSRELKNALRRYGGVCCVLPQTLVMDEAVSFIIIPTPLSHVCETSNAVLIFCADCHDVRFFSAPPNCVAIVESDNRSGIKILRQTPLPTITCGMAPHDTLSLSSMDDDAAAVSIQRELRALNGTVCEAMELPIKLTQPCAPFTMMALCAILLLRGDQELSTITI